MSRLVLVLVVAACGAAAAPPPVTTPPPHAPAPPEQDIATGAATLHFRVIDGALPTLLLEAGGGADSSSWHDLPAQLAQATGRKVLAYDRPGFGQSPLPAGELTVAAELDALDSALHQLRVDQVVIIAESYGAMIALEYTFRHPAAVAGLVLLDPMNADFITAVGIAKMLATAPKLEHPATTASARSCG